MALPRLSKAKLLKMLSEKSWRSKKNETKPGKGQQKIKKSSTGLFYGFGNAS